VKRERKAGTIENRHMVVLMHLLLYWETESVQRLLSPRFPVFQPFDREDVVEDVVEMTVENNFRRELLDLEVNLTGF
jgi:hypothetical protein